MKLNQFHADIHTREAVKEYLLEYLKEQAVTKAFNGDPTTGIKEAKEVINKAFKNLETLYGEKKSRTPQSNR